MSAVINKLGLTWDVFGVEARNHVSVGSNGCTWCFPVFALIHVEVCTCSRESHGVHILAAAGVVLSLATAAGLRLEGRLAVVQAFLAFDQFVGPWADV